MEDKIEALEKLIPTIHDSDKVTVLETPFTGLSGTFTQKHSMKPSGLWYSCGSDWLNWLTYEMPDWIHDYIYKLKISGNVLRIKNHTELMEFTRTYIGKSPIPDFEGTQFIDWVSVAKKYSGIEISPYIGSARMDRNCQWYYTWDVASGCIWDRSALAGAELYAQYDPSKKEFVIQGQNKMAAVRKIPVTGFSIDPEPSVATDFKEFTFEYTDNKGTHRSYTVSQRGEDRESFHRFAWKIFDARKGSYLPWADKEIKTLKERVDIRSPQEAEQMTLLASRVDDLANLLEAQGMLREAADLDVVANTLESLNTVKATHFFDEIANRGIEPGTAVSVLDTAEKVDLI